MLHSCDVPNHHWTQLWRESSTNARRTAPRPFRVPVGMSKTVFLWCNSISLRLTPRKETFGKNLTWSEGKGSKTRNLVDRILWPLDDPSPLSWINQICQNELYYKGLKNTNNITSKRVRTNNACVERCAQTNRTRTVRTRKTSSVIISANRSA